jgi:ribosomal protein L7/L12
MAENQRLADLLRAGRKLPLAPRIFASDTIGENEMVPIISFDLDSYRPDATLTTMSPRVFVGPQVGTARLFPLEAMSLFTALGGQGKTSTLMMIAALTAAGKALATWTLTRRKVLVFLVEETMQEAQRKFGAATHDWSQADRERAADNLRLISLVGQDPRLVFRHQKGLVPSPLVDQIITASQKFGAEVIILDHLQGFAEGDLNASDTATSLAMAANQIVAETGAAVVFAAHVNKSQIGAETVDAGFTTGSLAFENAARQMTGAIKVPVKEADGLGLGDAKDFVKLVTAKNSYGPAGETCILRKEFVPAFNTIRLVPHVAISKQMFTSKGDALSVRLEAYIRSMGVMTKAHLDAASGMRGPLRASRQKVREALQGLVDDGRVRLRVATAEKKITHRLPRQTKEIIDGGD